MEERTAELVDRFRDALRQLERDGQVETLVELFAPDCTVGNVASPKSFQGRDGARRFWHEYRALFERVESSFAAEIVGDDRAALEWHTSARLASGRDAEYDGVSLLDAADGQITRFYAYFDPSELGITL